jgi:outer membrane protein assembly factor BamB
MNRDKKSMPAKSWIVVFFLTLFTLLLVACIEPIGHEREVTPTPPAPHETPTATPQTPATVVPVSAIPPEVEQYAAEWPMANRNYGNTRATTDSQIKADNVDQLGVAWTYDLHGASKWGAAAGGTLIANKIVYFQDLKSNVFAIDLQSGALKWQKLFQQSAFGPNGPAIGWGKLFVQDGVNHVVALSLSNGDQLWSTPLFGPTEANQPLAYGGFVYTGVADGVYYENPGKPLHLNKAGTSGYAFGLDQANGTLIWSFQTVEEGFWGNPDVNSGAGVWFPPAIDTKTGMTYWSTGNPSPMPGVVDYPNASSRPGPNLYSESVLALDGKSGSMAWYNQVRSHDLLNYDLQNSNMLATAQIKGQQRDVVIATGKMGYVYAIDSASGEMYWKTPVGVHENDELQELPLDGTVITATPGFWGGIESPAATADGVVYVADVNLPSPYTATAFGSTDGDKAVTNIEGRIQYAIGNSEIIALDINTGAILWSTPLPAISFGAATVVNDLLFVADYEGVIYALTRADGHIVWKYQAPGGIIAWPAVAADTIVWPVGLGRTPQIVALRLGGKEKTVAPAARALPAASPTPAQ